MNTALLWYTHIFLLVLVIALIAKLQQKISGKYKDIPASVQIEELTTIPFHLIAFIALYSYLANMPIMSAVFWQIYVTISILLQIGSYWLPKQNFLRSKLSPTAYVSANIAAILPLLPLYYMLVNYSFISFPAGQ